MKLRRRSFVVCLTVAAAVATEAGSTAPAASEPIRPDVSHAFRHQQDRSTGAYHVPKETLIAQSASKLVLENSPLRVTLTNPAGSPALSLASQISSLAPGQRLFLILRGLHAEAAPGTLFHIFLDSPEGVPPDLKGRDPHRVGNFNFFNFVKSSDPNPQKTTRKPSRSYDITSLVRSLHKNAKLSPETTVTIVPGHAIEPGAHPAIERIELVIQTSASRHPG